MFGIRPYFYRIGWAELRPRNNETTEKFVPIKSCMETNISDKYLLKFFGLPLGPTNLF
jgi:hypothetical protein